jgi:hypothetical protein
MHGLQQEVFPVIFPDVFREEHLTFEQVCYVDVYMFNSFWCTLITFFSSKVLK